METIEIQALWDFEGCLENVKPLPIKRLFSPRALQYIGLEGRMRQGQLVSLVSSSSQSIFPPCWFAGPSCRSKRSLLKKSLGVGWRKPPREPRLRHHLKLIPKSDLHPKTLRVTRKKPRRGKVLEKDPVPIEHWCLFGWERPVEIKKEIPEVVTYIMALDSCCFHFCFSRKIEK